ncbi:MAG: response regulator [Chloroflexi bacterium]|nr:response regulator [Chloroflexota bacterium]
MDGEKGKILVVDDEEHVRHLLQRILEEAGYGVVMAATGDEALDKLPQTNVSLVLLDIRMPGRDGFQTLNVIREQSDIPVIMLTGIEEAASVRNALTLGADDYIKKPFGARELLARIEAKLRRAKT